MEPRRIQQLILLAAVVVPLLAQEIDSFSVEQTSTSVRVSLMLTTTEVGETGCFFDKITFVNGEIEYTPLYSGMCDFSTQTSNFLIGTMDVEDYVAVLQLQNLLTSDENSNIIIRGESRVSLVPGISVGTIRRPLSASDFTSFDGAINLFSFDIDYTTNQLLLHFDGLVNPIPLSITRVMLSASTDLSVRLSDSSAVQTQPTTTLCISLSSFDLIQLDVGVCRTATSCYCSIEAGLVTGYGEQLIAARDSLQVSVLRSPSVPGPVSMRLSLSYVGCSAVHTMAEDEVYVLRPNEYVSRIDCNTNVDMNASNIRPQITRGSSFSGSADATIEEYIVYNGPPNVYLNFPRALPSQLYGQYVCRSSIGYYIRNYIHDNNYGIELLGGSNYRVPHYDPLTISLYFGGYPHIDLTEPDIAIQIVDSETRNDISIEPTYDRINLFHVDISYDMVERQITGDYSLIINRDSTPITSQAIAIEVTDPVLTLVPEVAAIIPGQDELTLTCTSNSDRHQVEWYSDPSSMPLSSESTLQVQLPTDILEYTCSVSDGTNILISAVVPLRNVEDLLNVWQDDSLVEDGSLIELVQISSTLNCFEHIESTATNLTWVILSSNGSLRVPSTGKDGDVFRVVTSGNQASLTIDNSAESFLGLLKCFSSSGEVVGIRVVEDASVTPVMCSEEIDLVWRIQWSATISGNMDFQACPGTGTSGFALRQCNPDGEWNSTVNINDCSSESFINLKNRAGSMIFDIIDAYDQNELNGEANKLILMLNMTTQPRLTTHFPKDLLATCDVLESLLDVLSEESLISVLLDIFDNLLHTSNTEGWQQSDRGSQRLLGILEDFGVYLLQNIGGSPVQTFQRTNIVYSAMRITGYDQDIVFPMEFSTAQITLPTSLLRDIQPIGAVHVLINNLGDFLPGPDSGLLVASSMFSSQILRSSGVVNSFGDNRITIQFLTDGVPRATSPTCLFWNVSSSEDQWSSEGLSSSSVEVSSGEIKEFRVDCTTNHLTAFAVGVSVVISEFEFTIPVYVGCGFILFSSGLSIFSLLLSCMCDKLRKHSLVAFLIHFSFLASLLCAFVVFLAGIERALDNMIGCVAVAGLLHYFFTAAFTWLMLEGLLVIFFAAFSKRCGIFILIFAIGWGLPAIPTAISLGVLHESYGTTLDCLIYFDGQITDVLLGFIIPKLILIGSTLVLLMIGCCTNHKLGKKKIQPFLKTGILRILWFIWTSVLVFLIFLSAAWVFTLLLVNVYEEIGLDILQWVFMIACILLGLWMFLFSFTIMIINQKVDYERIWNPADPNYPSSDPGRGKGYQFMDMSSLDLSGRKSNTNTLTRLSSSPSTGLSFH